MIRTILVFSLFFSMMSFAHADPKVALWVTTPQLEDWTGTAQKMLKQKAKVNVNLICTTQECALGADTYYTLSGSYGYGSCDVIFSKYTVDSSHQTPTLVSQQTEGYQDGEFLGVSPSPDDGADVCDSAIKAAAKDFK